MKTPIPITVAHGDGIGPEIMESVLYVLREAGAPLAPEVIEVGRSVYERGFSSGIEPSAWDSLRRTRILLKAPITTPLGGGYKSLNVTIRKSLGLFANVRPCTSYHPLVSTKHPGMDVVVVRENEEDLYSGIEYRQSNDQVHCIKIASYPGTERIIRFAFEYARRYGRKKVTCLTKDNILKITDGLFHRLFVEVGEEYPEIDKDHLIIDIGAAKLADTPEQFDVIVTQNLYGDIVSDITAQIAGSVGLAGSANIGTNCAMFEAIHGSAPMIAGQNKANPSGLLQAASMMLVHLGEAEVATRVQNAWLRTIEQGIHTFDIFNAGVSRKLVGTREFGEAVCRNLGKQPEVLKAVAYKAESALQVPSPAPRPIAKRELVGVDVTIEARDVSPNDFATSLPKDDALELAFITNRGVKVWPEGMPEIFCTDQWRCRYMGKHGTVTQEQIVALLGRLCAEGVIMGKTEFLCTFDGERGYSMGQGE